MKFKIHGEDNYIIVEAETIEELRKQAAAEVEKRGWENYWSEEIEQ